MLASSNFFFLLSLAVVSWITLCLLNNGPKSHPRFYVQEPDKTTGLYNAKQWTRHLLSIVFAKNHNLVVYLICTLLGIYILYNLITRKVKAVAIMAASNKGQTSHLTEISRLKQENMNLLNTLKQLKLEKKMFCQHINLNASLIQKLRAEHAILKEKHEKLKVKFLNISNKREIYERKSSSSTICSEKVPDSSANIISHYFGKNKNFEYVDLTLTQSNHDTINRILREAYHNNNCSDIFDSNQSDSKTYVSSSSKCVFLPSSCSDESSIKDLQNINIVSTDQLEKIKGLAAPTLSTTYFSNQQIYEEVMRRKMEKII